MPRGSGPSPRPERYWTDYLRIALPIIGLVLMLSVFIFWVGSIIDSGNNDGEATIPVALGETPAPSDDSAGAGAETTTVPVTASEAPSSDGQPSSIVGSQSSDSAQQPTTAPDQATETPAETQATETPTEEASMEPSTDTGSGGGSNSAYAVDDVVVIPPEGDGARLRSDPTTDSDEVASLAAGTSLTIIGGPENDGEFDWYQVTSEDGSDEGWIREDLIAAQ